MTKDTSSEKERISPWELREIYRKQLLSKRRHDQDSCEDLAQEMFCIALETSKRKDIDYRNCTIRWMYADAISRVFGKYRPKGAFGEYCEHDPKLPILSSEDMENWFASNWTNFTGANGGHGRKRARYKIDANGIELEYDSDALCQLLSKKAVSYDRVVLSNFVKRGAKFFLIDGELHRASGSTKFDGQVVFLKCVGRV